MLVPPHFFVSTAFKKMRWKDEFRKWLLKLSILVMFLGVTNWPLLFEIMLDYIMIFCIVKSFEYIE